MYVYVGAGEGPLGGPGGDRNLFGGRYLHRAGDSAPAELPSGHHRGGEREARGRRRAAVEELDAAAEHLPHTPGTKKNKTCRVWTQNVLTSLPEEFARAST